MTDTAISMFKKRGPKGLRRKRPAEDTTADNDDSASDSESVVVQKNQRVDRNNPLIQGTTSIIGSSTKKGRWREHINGGEEEKEKKTSKAKEEEEEDLQVTYAARQEAKDSALKAREDATRSAWDIQEDDPKAQALINQALKDAEADGNELYRGQSGYRSFQTERDPSSASSASTGFALNSKLRAGPMRAPANIRVTCRFDYQPDICKDYKETGFCGYGDSCKFMHDRGDYKSGWQLDKEWDESHKSIANGGDPNEFLVESDSDEEIPFACLICRQPFDKPVVTKCGHYFCQKCALKRYAKTPKCMACGGPTSGVFKTAVKVLEKMRERERQKHENEGSKDSGEEEENYLDNLPVEGEGALAEQSD